jgi:hypothetical protein
MIAHAAGFCLLVPVGKDAFFKERLQTVIIFVNGKDNGKQITGNRLLNV